MNPISTWKSFATRVTAVMAVALFVAVLVSPHLASAARAYGEGPYNACGYQNACPTPPSPPPETVVTLPTGLKVTINLEDGQTIPSDGYKITVTPEASSSKSIKSATFLIDDIEAQTVAVSDDGTVSWKWLPREFPGSKVTIVITADDDSTTTFNFTVKIGNAASSGSGSGSGGTFKPGSGGDATPGTGTIPILAAIVPEGVREAFRALPPAVVNTFPYLLLLLLGLVAIVVLLQIKRELAANRKLAAMIEQEKVMLELKKNFLGLASHYLRTPMTMISQGLELIALKKAATPETIAKLKAAALKLNENIVGIITLSAETTPVTENLDNSRKGTIRVGIWVLIMIAIFIVAIFNLLAADSGRSLPMANLLTQIVGLVLVSLVLYQIDRRFILRRREHRMQDELLALQKQLQDSQDAFLEQSASQLNEGYAKVRELTETIPVDAVTKPLHEGVLKLYDVISKCQTARQLKGARSVQNPVLTTLSEVLDYSEPKLFQMLNAKQLELIKPTDKQVTIQEPPLLQNVTRSLIDNAIAYSPEAGKITLAADDTGDKLNVTVQDEGKGISKDRQQLLFQPLSKIEGYENFDHEGMGFSLYLDKLIMEYLGGSIDLQSEENKGTRVQLTLPVNAQAHR